MLVDMSQIVVWGLGYLGATHAVAMASLGHQVVGVDIDERKTISLRGGKPEFYEPGLEGAIQRLVDKGDLTFNTSIERVQSPRVHFICVGTPQESANWKLDTSQLTGVCRSLGRVVGENDVVVGKSTVPIGTAATLRKILTEEAGFKVRLVWNPEFLREGSALHDSLKPDRIVIGSWASDGVEELKQVYKQILDDGTPLLETSIETAELVKVAANAFLATKISFINAMAEIAEVSGADAVQLAKAIGYDERIGRKFLRNGIGFGGGCLPKDIRGFVARAEELGAGKAVSFLKDVDAINQRRRVRVLALAERELGELKNKNVLMLGLSFKPDSDDMRDSPALDIALRLAKAGAKVAVHDPVALSALGDKHPELIREQDLSAAAKNQELTILGTEWSEYKAIEPKAFGKLVANKLIIDGRNVLDVAAWQAAGWRLIALGRNVHN